MKDFFFKLMIDDLQIWALRYLIILSLPVLMAWLLHIFMIRFEDKEVPIIFTRRLALNKSIIIVLFLCNVYWYYFFKINGLDVFNFLIFPLSRFNVYFALSPYISLYVLMLFWYKSNNDKLLKSI